jgi:tetratricopeptide (TPR) repeat protein
VKTRWILLAVLVAATLLAYANSLSNPFVFDDQNAIVENETIRTLTPITTALQPAWQSATAGRPLVNLSLAMNYAAGGLSPWGYHATNLVIHLLCGLLLFGIVRRTLVLSAARAAAATLPIRVRGRPSARSTAPDAVDAEAFWPSAVAFACASLWLLHPLQTELVDYVIQRTESMMALAFLATLYATLRAATTDRPAAWTVAAITACAAGMLCKESMATAPLMVFLFDVVFCAGSVKEAIRRRGRLYLGLAATWILLAAMIMPGPRWHSAGFSAGISPWTYLLNQAPIILRYVRTAFWPAALVFDYGMPRDITLQQAMLPGALIVISIVAVAAAWRRHRALAFLGTWFFVTLAPASSIIPIATEAGAERRMYLPLAALIVAIVVPISRAVRRDRMFLGATAILALVLGGLTARRNAEYHDVRVLWQTVLDRYPHGRAHYGVGLALKDEGHRADALRELEIATKDFAEADYALGFELSEQGAHARALEYLQKYVREKPDDVNAIRAYVLIGRSQMAQDHVKEAEEAFRQVLHMHAGDSDALGGLADTLSKQERWREAIPVYAEYTNRVRNNPTAYFNLGLALLREQRPEEAIAPLTSAVALTPSDPGARANLAMALALVGRFDEAAAHYRRVAALDPDPEVQQQIRQALQEIDVQKKGGTGR